MTMHQVENEVENSTAAFNDAIQTAPDCNDSNLVSQKYNPNKWAVHLKVLVPSIAVGSIIGKGGESISAILKDNAARIKLSKPDDLYPGTTDRVCLIQGNLESVTEIHDYIIDRIYDRPDETSAFPGTLTSLILSSMKQQNSNFPKNSPSSISVKSNDELISSTIDNEKISSLSNTQNTNSNHFNWERHRQAKILVPNCTAGLVIGKKGSYVAVIKRVSGAYVQLSQNSTDVNLTERTITIAGNSSEIKAAARMVLSKIAEDPQSSSCPQISYSNCNGPIASAHPVGSPFAVPPSNINKQQPGLVMLGYPMSHVNSIMMASMTSQMSNNSPVPIDSPIYIQTQQGPIQYMRSNTESNYDPVNVPSSIWPVYPFNVPNRDYYMHFSSPSEYNQYMNLIQSTPTVTTSEVKSLEQAPAQTFINSPISSPYYMPQIFVLNGESILPNTSENLNGSGFYYRSNSGEQSLGYRNLPDSSGMLPNNRCGQTFLNSSSKISTSTPVQQGAIIDLSDQMTNLQFIPNQTYQDPSNLQTLYCGDMKYFYNKYQTAPIQCVNSIPFTNEAINNSSYSQANQETQKDTVNKRTKEKTDLLWSIEKIDEKESKNMTENKILTSEELVEDKIQDNKQHNDAARYSPKQKNFKQ